MADELGASPPDPLERFRHEGDAGPGVLANLPALERALQAAKFPAMTAWWRETFERFYSSRQRQLVLRVGRRGGKSTSLCRIAVLEALFGEHQPSPGDLLTVAIISVDRREATGRMRTVKAILAVLAIEWKPIENGIELVGRGVAFVIFTASVGGVSGFSCVCAICDEVAKWRDYETGSNPATEVLASLRPTLAGQPNARLYLSSSPMGTRDAHAVAFDLGETALQFVAWAPTWIARPLLTEEDCRALEPDEDTCSREYGAIPFDGSTAMLFTLPMLMAVTRSGVGDLPCDGSPHFAAQDPASRGNAWTLVIAREAAGRVTVVLAREWRPEPGRALDSGATIGELGGVLAEYRTRELWSDQWSFDALSALAVPHGIHLREAVSTQASNVQLFDGLKRRIVDGTIELPDNQALRSDLLGVSKWIAKGGAFSIELERRGSRHSDFAPALALAVAKAGEHAELTGGVPEDDDFRL